MNTDDYEGHTPGPWKIEHFPELDAVRESYYDEDLKLIAAAPDLLAEVKRLQKRNEWLEEVVAQAQEHYHIDLSDEGWPRWEEEE